MFRKLFKSTAPIKEIKTNPRMIGFGSASKKSLFRLKDELDGALKKQNINLADFVRDEKNKELFQNYQIVSAIYDLVINLAYLPRSNNKSILNQENFAIIANNALDMKYAIDAYYSVHHTYFYSKKFILSSQVHVRINYWRSERNYIQTLLSHIDILADLVKLLEKKSKIHNGIIFILNPKQFQDVIYDLKSKAELETILYEEDFFTQKSNLK